MNVKWIILLFFLKNIHPSVLCGNAPTISNPSEKEEPNTVFRERWSLSHDDLTHRHVDDEEINLHFISHSENNKQQSQHDISPLSSQKLLNSDHETNNDPNVVYNNNSEIKLESTSLIRPSSSTLVTSSFRSGNCTDCLVLSKRLRHRLLVQVSLFLRVKDFILVMTEEDKDRCSYFGRVLYKSNIRTTCSTLSRLEGYHPAVIFIASEKDKGARISETLQQMSLKTIDKQLTIGDIVVILLSPATILQAPQARMRYSVLQAKSYGVEFSEVFTFGPSSSTSLEEVVAVWNPLEQPPLQPVPFKGSLVVPKDFMGNVVRIAYFETYPEVFISVDSYDKSKFVGYSADVFELLGKQLNFSLQWISPKEKVAGLPSANGSFTGVVGLLQRKEADVSVPALGIYAERLRAIDFSSAVDYGAAQLLIYKGSTFENIQWSTYFTGFEGSVWIAIVLLWIVMSLGLVAVSQSDLGITFCNTLFIFMGVIAQQASPVVPDLSKGRLVFLSFWMGCLILTTSYKASLTSHLAVVITHDPFSSLGEAITKAGYSVAVREGSGYILDVEGLQHKSEVFKLLNEQWKSRPELLVASDDDGIALIQSSKEKYAFFRYNKAMNPKIEHNCSFASVGGFYFPDYVYYGYAKNLSYGYVLSHYLTKLRDTGILDKLNKKWWGTASACTNPETQEFGFSKTLSAFVVLIAGAMLAFFLQAMEIIFNKMRSKQKIKRSVHQSKSKNVGSNIQEIDWRKFY